MGVWEGEPALRSANYAEVVEDVFLYGLTPVQLFYDWSQPKSVSGRKTGSVRSASVSKESLLLTQTSIKQALRKQNRLIEREGSLRD